jgi:hypothetical protein
MRTALIHLVPFLEQLDGKTLSQAIVRPFPTSTTYLGAHEQRESFVEARTYNQRSKPRRLILEDVFAGNVPCSKPRTPYHVAYNKHALTDPVPVRVQAAEITHTSTCDNETTQLPTKAPTGRPSTAKDRCANADEQLMQLPWRKPPSIVPRQIRSNHSPSLVISADVPQGSVRNRYAWT